jgi:hypothetical protein
MMNSSSASTSKTLISIDSGTFFIGQNDGNRWQGQHDTHHTPHVRAILQALVPEAEAAAGCRKVDVLS